MTRTQAVTELMDRNKEEVEARIAYGIEAHRKGSFCLRLMDESGVPAAGVRVKIEQIGHEFQHGANLFMLDQHETAEKNQKYRAAFAECFNLATLPFYWDTLEPEEGNPRFGAESSFVYRRPPVDPCLAYCRENGIAPKAHCLNYDHFTPAWLLGADVAEIKRRLAGRFEILAKRYRDEINCWEVGNELLCHNGATAFYNDPEILEWSFRMAERYFPRNELMINESNWHIFSRKNGGSLELGNRNPYYMLVERALHHGARIDSIGMQFHLFFKKELEGKNKAFYDFSAVYRILDQFALLGKPLQITEVTVPAYDNTAEDYALQAEILRRLLRIWFSHPAIEGVVYWNLVDGYAYQAEPGDMTAGENYYRGGLLDFDLNPKPAYRAMADLFQKEWHTALSGESGADGTLQFRGFYGRYRVTLEQNGVQKEEILDFKKTGGHTRQLQF